jgi:hypothetical protein
MAKKKRNKEEENRPVISEDREGREALWDDLYEKEEGLILEFDSALNKGKVKSLRDGSIYNIDDRELIRTKIELRPGDKVLFAPFEDPHKGDYARIIRILELNV